MTSPHAPTAQEIYAAVRSYGPRGHRRFTEAMAKRVAEVVQARAQRVGASKAATNAEDYDAMAAEVLTRPVGSVLGAVLAFGLNALAQYLIGLCVRWACEWAWKRYRSESQPGA